MTTAFTELGLSKALTDNLARINISEPTPVQAEAIPVVTAGRDLIATAPTGTGKTGAFLLPVLEKLIANPKPGRGPRVLVLSPTRELAAQIGKAAKSFSEGIPRVKTVTITGGESYQQQNRVLERPYEILIATPGRLIDQIGSDRIDLSRVEVLILDEADRMMDIGFTDAVLEIAGKVPAEHQTLCFTATMSNDVQQLSAKLLKDPHRIDVVGDTHMRDNITQRVIFTDGLEHKHKLLRHWITHEEAGQVIVFTATKRDADEIAEGLVAEGLPAIALHGDLTQRARTRSLNQLRSGEARILIATDVAARGIDVSGISHVINFDLPKFAEDYVHRIGRTGRAGLDGAAISFVGRQDVGALRRIERFVGKPIEEMKVEGLESNFKPDARGPRREGRFDDRRGGGQRRDQQHRGPRDGQGQQRFGKPRPQGGFRDRNDRNDRGDRQPKFAGDDRQPRFGGDEQPRFGGDEQPRQWKDRADRGNGNGNSEQRPPRGPRQDRGPGQDRGPRQDRGPKQDRPWKDKPPRQDRGPRDDNFGNRGPRDDNFGNRGASNPDSGNRAHEDRQPKFVDEDRQPFFGGGDDEQKPHYYDERQPDSNDNRAPAFDVAARKRKGPPRGQQQGGQRYQRQGGGNGNYAGNDNRGNHDGNSGSGNNEGGTHEGGNRPPRAAKPGGKKPFGKKPFDKKPGSKAGAGKQGGNRPPRAGGQQQRGRRPKQVGLYLPETPAQRSDWRNERLSDAPKKPKIIKKGDKNERSRGGGDGGESNNTWTFTGRTLRLKRKEGEE